jgi:predicted PurR-regulated permease PerM
MAVPVVVVKSIAVAATDKRVWKVIAVLITSLLTPIILMFLMIGALISGTESANQSLLNYSFKGVSISQDFTDEQRGAVEDIRDWLVELDIVIAENENQYSLDGDMIKAVFYCLNFGREIDTDFDNDGFCECFDGLTMEQLDEALQNISEKFTQYEITDTIKAAVQSVYAYLKN